MKTKKHTGIVAQFERKLSELHFPGKLIFFLTGIAATIWFLVRVIPKPSRAAYPCMQAAAPVASAFVIYLLSLTATVISFKKMASMIRGRRLAISLVFALATVVFTGISIATNRSKVSAGQVMHTGMGQASNIPVGTARGYMPGRVVWIHDADATNENMTNSTNDYWYENANQEIIDKMMTEGIMQLADTNNIAVAWNRLFEYFNKQKHGVEKGYVSGEKFAIKLNLTNDPGRPKDVMNSTPELALAILRQLVNVVGVSQSDITIGDPFRFYHDYLIALLYNEFPDVNYIDAAPTNESHFAVKQTVVTNENSILFSDGKKARLPIDYMEADYFINMPCLKSHNAAGITICAKNHQGSALLPGQEIHQQFMGDLHHSFPTSPGQEGYGKYRHLVDYMGHEKLGGNTMLNIVDAVWGGHNWEGIVYKWQSDPFNNDYPSSILFSQDQVAIDAVGYDILLNEYNHLPSGDGRKGQEYPYFEGTNDYLVQAADPANWPNGITYDPENDGTPITSLGVYEHWDSPVTRRYTRNLGTGDGIELTYSTTYSDQTYAVERTVEKVTVTPNPFSQSLSFNFTKSGNYTLSLYSLDGKLVHFQQYTNTNQLVFHSAHTNLETGLYIYNIKGDGTFSGKVSFNADN